MLTEDKITQVDGVNISYSNDEHPYHLKFSDIALENWAKETQRKPELFNGKILLFSKLDLADSKIECVCHSVPYSTYIHWRASRDKIGFHLFPVPIIVSSEGYPILGKMAAHTFHAGEHYSPSGSLDEDDIADNMVDPFVNMTRELREETDLDLLQAKDMSDYFIHIHDNKVALFKVFKFQMKSTEIMSQVNEYIKNDPAAELEKVISISSLADSPKKMPAHMKPILDWYFENSAG